LGAILVFWGLCSSVLAVLVAGGFELWVREMRVENRCTMTRMWPNYYPVPGSFEASDFSLKYKILGYSHGNLTLEQRQNLNNVSKVVLFVPGNAGSFQQVRSIGCELVEDCAEGLHLKNVREEVNVMVYTLDFDEELSALSGLFLRDQTQFTVDMLRLIGKRHKDAQVVLFAHSMGGIVAREVLAQMDADPELLPEVNILGMISVATPHVSPMIGMDFVMLDIYRDIWQHQDSKRAYLSFAGGYRDNLVRSELAQLHREQYERSASVLTSTLPEVGMSIDHLAILWCNELVALNADQIMAIFNNGFEEVLKSKGIARKKIPSSGSTKDDRKAYTPESEIFAWVKNVPVRKHLPLIFQYVFTASLLTLMFAAGSSIMDFVTWSALPAILILVFQNDGKKTLQTVPILLASAFGIMGFIVLSCQVFLRVLHFVIPAVPSLTLLISPLAFSYFNGNLPSMDELLAISMLCLILNVVVLALGTISKARGMFASKQVVDAQHVQILFSLAYFASLAAWASPAIFCAKFLSERRQNLSDHFPVKDENRRGHFFHGVLDDELPEAIEMLMPASSRSLDESDRRFLIVSCIAILPVAVHLWMLYNFPIFASSEQVLDSSLERVRMQKRRSQGASEDTKETTKADQLEVALPQSERPRKSKVVEAVEIRPGVLLFDDTEYEDGDSLRVHRFKNGEVVQLDYVRDSDEGMGRSNADAVPLMDESGLLQQRSGIMLIQKRRIRSGVDAIPDSIILRTLIGLLALTSISMSSTYLFILQYMAPLLSIIALIFRSEERSFERTERRTIADPKLQQK